MLSRDSYEHIKVCLAESFCKIVANQLQFTPYGHSTEIDLEEYRMGLIMGTVDHFKLTLDELVLNTEKEVC